MTKSRSISASNRSFGLVIGLAFVLIGIWKYESGAWSHLIWIAIGAVFLLLAILMPRLLRPAKTLWLRFGQLLGQFLSPAMLAAVYVLSIVPIGLLLKLFGKDPCSAPAIQSLTAIGSHGRHQGPTQHHSRTNSEVHGLWNKLLRPIRPYLCQLSPAIWTWPCHAFCHSWLVLWTVRD